MNRGSSFADETCQGFEVSKPDGQVVVDQDEEFAYENEQYNGGSNMIDEEQE